MSEDNIKRQQEMTWLESLQKNSWEPEVIISGITLAFLFIIPTKLFDFSVQLIQDFGLEQIPALLILVYFSLIISVFKIFLVVHLVMRFIWAGMLGITYAFPQGVIREKLFKYSQNVEYPHPNVYLLKLERWCSILYGMPISVAIPLFFITLYLIGLIGIYLFFDLQFQVIYLVFMISVIGFAITSLAKKRSKLKEFVGASMSGTVGAIYQSNLGKWAFVSFSLGLVAISAPFMIADLKGFSTFQPNVNLSEEEFLWPDDSQYFEEYNQGKRRFARMWTSTKTVSGDWLDLYLAWYKREDRAIPKMNEKLKEESLSWGEIKSFSDQYRIYLNDSLVSSKKWVNVKSGLTGQRAVLGLISIAHLNPGFHEIRLEKLTYLEPFLSVGDELRHRKSWAKFEFIKK